MSEPKVTIQHFLAFSLGQLQAAKTAVNIMHKEKISREDFVAAVDFFQFNPKERRKLLSPPEALTSPVIMRHRSIFCPKCGDGLYIRMLRDNPKGYRSNFACMSDECDFDYYTKRTVGDVYNAGIGEYDPPSTPEGVEVESVEPS